MSESGRIFDLVATVQRDLYEEVAVEDVADVVDVADADVAYFFVVAIVCCMCTHFRQFVNFTFFEQFVNFICADKKLFYYILLPLEESSDHCKMILSYLRSKYIYKFNPN